MASIEVSPANVSPQPPVLMVPRSDGGSPSRPASGRSGRIRRRNRGPGSRSDDRLRRHRPKEALKCPHLRSPPSAHGAALRQLTTRRCWQRSRPPTNLPPCRGRFAFDLTTCCVGCIAAPACSEKRPGASRTRYRPTPMPPALATRLRSSSKSARSASFTKGPSKWLPGCCAVTWGSECLGVDRSVSDLALLLWSGSVCFQGRDEYSYPPSLNR